MDKDRKPITTEVCKQAIVDYVKTHPGCVASQYSTVVAEAPAQLIQNWKRETKERCKAGWLRRFACRAYGDGDELRAYVIATETTVLTITIQGE